MCLNYNNLWKRKSYLVQIESRNKKIRLSDNAIVRADFEEYADGLLERMWHYAKLSGLKEFV